MSVLLKRIGLITNVKFPKIDCFHILLHHRHLYRHIFYSRTHSLRSYIIVPGRGQNLRGHIPSHWLFRGPLRRSMAHNCCSGAYRPFYIRYSREDSEAVAYRVTAETMAVDAVDNFKVNAAENIVEYRLQAYQIFHSRWRLEKDRILISCFI